jgi:hypothetical protein
MLWFWVWTGTELVGIYGGMRARTIKSADAVYASKTIGVVLAIEEDS